MGHARLIACTEQEVEEWTSQESRPLRSWMAFRKYYLSSRTERVEGDLKENWTGMAAQGSG